MANFHFNPKTGRTGKCDATVRPCRFGQTQEQHGNTPADARANYERSMESELLPTAAESKKPAPPKTLKQAGEDRFKNLTKREKELRERNKDLAQTLVDVRAQSADGIVYDDANETRAKRRLNEAIEYANARGNSNLTDKLTSSRVLPSGAFVTADGRRVNTDAALKNYVTLKHIDSERERHLRAIKDSIGNEELKESKFSHKDANGSYSMTVSNGLDTRAFDELPDGVKDKISSPSPSLSIERAREVLDKDTLEKVTTKQQTLDFVVGKEPDVGKSKTTVSTEIPAGGSADDRARAGLQNVAKFYDGVRKEHGPIRELKSYKADSAEAIKTAAAKRDGNTFIPARSQMNGGLVSGRTVLAPKAVKEHLTEEQQKAITEQRPKPDPEKAKAVLSSEEYERVFNARKVGLRFTEAKS